MLQILLCVCLVLLQPNGYIFSSALKEKFNFKTRLTPQQCHEDAEVECMWYKEHNLNGSCNNRLNPFNGKIKTPLKRLIPAAYANKYNASRVAASGEPLPSARVISNTFNGNNNPINHNSTKVNALFPYFAQFVGHDIVTMKMERGVDGRSIDCSCSEPDSRCLNIPIPADDPFYEDDETCITTPAAAWGQSCENHTDLEKEQINTITSYLDAGTIYGWDDETVMQLLDPDTDFTMLRLASPADILNSINTTSTSGVLRWGECQTNLNLKILPRLTDFPPSLQKSFDNFPGRDTAMNCFASGNVRVNENIALSSINLAFTRLHNRIVQARKETFPELSTKEMFKGSREILIGLYQMIIYNEFLPLLLGEKLMKMYDLKVAKSGYYNGYDVTYDATASNSFATAAFRFQSSQMKSSFDRLHSNYEEESGPSIRVFEALFNQEAVINGTDASIIRGLMKNAAKLVDLEFVEDLRNRMFESDTQAGQDLLAINIEMGRKHGLPSYNEYREYCGVSRLGSWADLARYMPKERADIFQNLYESIQDIDLYVAGLAETPMPGAVVGPTFGCIIARQFRDLKKGDRLYFENPGLFPIDQLNEIRKVTLSGILCENMDRMITISPRALEVEGATNGRVPCSEIPRVDYTKFGISPRQTFDGVWTRWFPANDETPMEVFQRITHTDYTDICISPIKFETRGYDGNAGGIVRFKCPHGTLRASNFPNARDNLNYYWTPWFDRDTPRENGDDVESLELLRQERPREVCEFPLFIQAKTKDEGTVDIDTEVLTECNNKKGLICRGQYQEGGRCKDYRVRFYCPTTGYKDNIDKVTFMARNLSDAKWTEWINVSSPESGLFDLEALELAKRRGHNVCSSPLLIEGRIAGTNTTIEQSGNVLYRFSARHGLICDNRDQFGGKCLDFEVRYLCSESVTSITQLLQL